MNRHEYREKIVFVLYQSLLLKKDLETTFNDVFVNLENEDTSDDNIKFLMSLKSDLVINYQNYINEIEPLLIKWSFDRLAYLDQAILIEAVSELKLNLNDKKIVIDEAINIAKKYSNADSYKYINGVLDRV